MSLRIWRERLGKTILFVTHDLREGDARGVESRFAGGRKIVADARREEFLRVGASGSAGVCGLICDAE